eukprot:466798-Pleurochrysis_carterae.AAC.1
MMLGDLENEPRYFSWPLTLLRLNGSRAFTACRASRVPPSPASAVSFSALRDDMQLWASPRRESLRHNSVEWGAWDR